VADAEDEFIGLEQLWMELEIGIGAVIEGVTGTFGPFDEGSFPGGELGCRRALK